VSHDLLENNKEELFKLIEIDSDLAYAAGLFLSGAKRGYRHEGWDDLSDEEKNIIRKTMGKMGIKWMVYSHPERNVLLFGEMENVEAYRKLAKFPISSTDTSYVKRMGEVLDYPPCCTESFIVRGYNNPETEFLQDFSILFHFPCRTHCERTDALMPAYRMVWKFISQLNFQER